MANFNFKKARKITDASEEHLQYLWDQFTNPDTYADQNYYIGLFPGSLDDLLDGLDEFLTDEERMQVLQELAKIHNDDEFTDEKLEINELVPMKSLAHGHGLYDSEVFDAYDVLPAERRKEFMQSVREGKYIPKQSIMEDLKQQAEAAEGEDWNSLIYDLS